MLLKIKNLCGFLSTLLFLLFPICFFSACICLAFVLPIKFTLSYFFNINTESSSKAFTYLFCLIALILFAYFGDVVVNFVILGRRLKDKYTSRVNLYLQNICLLGRKIVYLILAIITIILTFSYYLLDKEISPLATQVLLSFIAIDRYIEKFHKGIINRIEDKQKDKNNYLKHVD
ncbi:hypothetical protein OEA_13125 [Priestia megaterium NCT-2]|uniref:hypothetical protein n=1 Tax=Priestia megaterium TaxID=1404 RepID=UPI000EB74E7C|nr:hypothetical protein [Priestia megaterium]AYE50681.1 hypothetical protein OEA_13125 [Priestia megaterium NCT-2]